MSLFRLFPWLAGIAYVALLFAFSGFVADDAMIVGRYGQNFARGLGLVYNQGEYVSALTSPLHAVLVAAMALASDDPVAVYRWIAPIFPVLGFWLAVREVSLSKQQLAFFAVFALGSPFLGLWTRGGLETPMLAGLMTAFGGCVVALTRAKGNQPGSRMLLAAVFASLAVLTRFDAIIVILPFVVGAGLLFYRNRVYWLSVILGGTIVLIWLVFSWQYYHEVLPTSAFVKLGALSNPFVDHLVTNLNFLGISGLAVVFLFISKPSFDERNMRVMGVAGAVSAIAFIVYSLNASGQHMMFGYRFFVPYLGFAGLFMSFALGKRINWAIAAVVLANSIGTYNIFRQGITPTLLIGVPIFGQANPEMTTMRPKDYIAIIEGRKADALAVADHWRQLGRTDEPSIFLHSGGIGYWLPDFYVYETLVSYRHGCREQLKHMFLGPFYRQEIDILPVTPDIQAWWALRKDIVQEVVTESNIYLFEDTTTRFWYGSDPSNYRLSAYVGAECT